MFEIQTMNIKSNKFYNVLLERGQEVQVRLHVQVRAGWSGTF